MAFSSLLQAVYEVHQVGSRHHFVLKGVMMQFDPLLAATQPNQQGRGSGQQGLLCRCPDCLRWRPLCKPDVSALPM